MADFPISAILENHAFQETDLTPVDWVALAARAKNLEAALVAERTEAAVLRAQVAQLRALAEDRDGRLARAYGDACRVADILDRLVATHTESGAA